MAVKTGRGDLSQIEQIEKAWLSVDEVSQVLGCNPDSIRTQARQDPMALGFPVCIIGHTTKIPKDGFLFWMRYGYPKP